jgi:hypothetical protein
MASSVSDALNDVKEMFVKTVLRDQDCFRHERGWDTLLALIPDKGNFPRFGSNTAGPDLTGLEDVVDSLRSRWQNSESSSQTKWTDLLKAREKLSEQHLRYVSSAHIRSMAIALIRFRKTEQDREGYGGYYSPVYISAN